MRASQGIRRFAPALASAGLFACPQAYGESAAMRTIIDLQADRQASTLSLEDERGPLQVTLINLNPAINAWFVLRLQRGSTAGASASASATTAEYHLENPAPRHQHLRLDPAQPGGLWIDTSVSKPVLCPLWSGKPGSALEAARRAGASYAPLCESRLFLRNPNSGYRTSRELVTEFLRDRVWGGEKIIGFIRDRVLRDAYLERAEPASPGSAESTAAVAGPLPAQVVPAKRVTRPLPPGLGIEPNLPLPGQVTFGSWYPARIAPDVYVSIMQADLIDPAVLAGHTGRLRALDPVEGSALAYLVAFPLQRYTLGFETGTDHPRVGWSERSQPAMRDPALPGPDGFGTIDPLVSTGLVSPAGFPRTAAAFTGGFKRAHGAFRYGELARVNQGSHYGWMEQGVVFSSLQPGLATVLVMRDGQVDVRVWQTADRSLLPDIRHARQNGVPVVDTDPQTGEPVPGAQVNQWGAGNWSGSAEGSLRTVRAGMCLQGADDAGYLIYGYFSSVTPSAMARVLLAYRCRTALQLDMNALEHTYLALYGVGANDVTVQHLVKGMEEVDKAVKGQPVPRFIGYPDNRDFFIVMRRQENEP